MSRSVPNTFEITLLSILCGFLLCGLHCFTSFVIPYHQPKKAKFLFPQYNILLLTQLILVKCHLQEDFLSVANIKMLNRRYWQARRPEPSTIAGFRVSFTYLHISK